MVSKKPKLLILAQTPPPFHGQSIMQEFLVKANWGWCDKQHIRLDFSSSINEVGKFKLGKLAKTIKLYKEIFSYFINNPGKKLVYYPPASPNRVPFYRDIMLLSCIRLFTNNIIFQFHSGGLEKLYPKLNFIEKWFFKRVYQKPLVAIALLPSLQKEVEWTNPHKSVSIPNGIEDVFSKFVKYSKEKEANHLNVLFVGNIKKEKGIYDIIESVGLLKGKVLINLTVVGDWHSEVEKRDIENKVNELGLKEHIHFLGVLKGDQKWQVYANSDVFCLPTFENEAMPITLLEAMMFALPVITTKWRAIPDMLEDGKEGFLVPIKNPEAISAKLSILHEYERRKIMGKQARESFLAKYTLQTHLFKMESLIKSYFYN
jgi:glycosyltransferase involved in cell wall biosynthesis